MQVIVLVLEKADICLTTAGQVNIPAGGLFAFLFTRTESNVSGFCVLGGVHVFHISLLE